MTRLLLISAAVAALAGSAHARMGPDAAARAAERWTQDDRNKDGFLSRAEIQAAGKRRFDVADRNHDGWLSKGELLTMRENRRGGAGG